MMTREEKIARLAKVRQITLGLWNINMVATLEAWDAIKAEEQQSGSGCEGAAYSAHARRLSGESGTASPEPSGLDIPREKYEHVERGEDRRQRDEGLDDGHSRRSGRSRRQQAQAPAKNFPGATTALPGACAEKVAGASTEAKGATGRCEPPPEHQNKEWHWLVCDGGQPTIWPWIIGFQRWLTPGALLTTEQVAHRGWRYVAPAIPPEPWDGKTERRRWDATCEAIMTKYVDDIQVYDDRATKAEARVMELEAEIAKALADARAEGIEMAIKVVESGVFLHMDSPMAKEAKSLVAALRNLLVE